MIRLDFYLCVCVCDSGLHQPVCCPHHVWPDDERGQTLPTEEKAGHHQWSKGATWSVHYKSQSSSQAECFQSTQCSIFAVTSVAHSSSALLEMIRKVLSLDDKIKSIANELYQQRSLLVMGRGYNYATCLEGALVSETCPGAVHSSQITQI